MLEALCVQLKVLFPKFHYELLSLDVQDDVVVVTPAGSLLQIFLPQIFLFILLFISFFSVMPSTNLMIVRKKIESKKVYVHREYSRGPRTQPWGAPLLRMRLNEECLPTLITWSLAIRKCTVRCFIPSPSAL